jgi:hypothetical protein
MKSMLMSSHFQEGMGKGWRVPAVFKWLALILEHVLHSETYFAMSTFMLDHQKLPFKSWYILLLPELIENLER